MVGADARREEIVARLGAHLLAAGLPGASLRPLAAAAGTSDRMLLYYFRDKTELLTVVLTHLATRLAVAMEGAVPPASQPFAALLASMRGAVRGPEVAPFMRLWLDMAARAGRGEAPFTAIAAAIAGGFLAWIDARLDAPAAVRGGQAALLLALVEGMAVLDAVDHAGTADMAMQRAAEMGSGASGPSGVQGQSPWPF